MKKLAVLCLFILSGLGTAAYNEADYYVDKGVTKDGYSIFKVYNTTAKELYCFVEYNNGYGFFDFYIDAYGTSRWYYEPSGYYDLRCK